MSKKSRDQRRARYTLEFKLEAVRLVKAGQEASVTARVLGMPKQSLSNWVRLAERVNCRASMSRRANCWDNAPTESLWGSLRLGRLYGRKFATQRAAMDEVIDRLTFYNHRRLYSTLGYVSPMKFKASWHAGQTKKAA
jgi:transposase InsO family protein